MNTALTTPSWVPDGQTLDDIKRKFAGELFKRPDNEAERMNAAKLVFPRQDQVFLALEAAQNWITDPVVIAELDRLKVSGADIGLPTKADIARRYMSLADDKTVPVETRIKALDRYTEMMGYKPTPGGIGGVGITIDQRRVFVLPPAQNASDWERDTIKQQSKLIEGNVSKRE